MMKVIQNDLRQILISLFFLPLSDGESAGYSNFLQKLCPNLLVILPLHIHSGRFHVPTVNVFNAVLVGFMDQYRCFVCSHFAIYRKDEVYCSILKKKPSPFCEAREALICIFSSTKLIYA